jgi:hypothetical protein
MTSPFVITHSDISAFLRCRRKWAWGFVDDYRTHERPVGAAHLGTRVHDAIEAWYINGDDPIEVHDRLVRADITQLETTDAPGWEVDQLYTEMIIGRNCITAHQQWLEETGADAEFEVVSVEEKLEAPILDGKAILRGKADVLFRSQNDGRIYVNDLKTTGAQGSVRETFERSYQAPIYVALAGMREGLTAADIGGAFYTVMRKTKNLARATRSTVERFSVPAIHRTAEARMAHIEQIATEMIATAEQYRAGAQVVAYPSPMESCRWCEFKQPCELQDENSEAAAAMLGAEYEYGRKHARYDAS